MILLQFKNRRDSGCSNFMEILKMNVTIQYSNCISLKYNLIRQLSNYAEDENWKK